MTRQARRLDQLSWPLGTLLVLHGALGGALSAQSLGDVAARETERREHRQAKKVYTNDDLKRFTPLPDPPVPTATAAGPQPVPNGAQGDTSRPAANEGGEQANDSGTPQNRAPNKQDEASWRARAQDLQRRVDRLSADIAALRAGSDGGDTARVSPAEAKERETNGAVLAKLRQHLTWMNEELGRFRE